MVLCPQTTKQGLLCTLVKVPEVLEEDRTHGIALQPRCPSVHLILACWAVEIELGGAGPLPLAQHLQLCPLASLRQPLRNKSVVLGHVLKVVIQLPEVPRPAGLCEGPVNGEQALEIKQTQPAARPQQPRPLQNSLLKLLPGEVSGGERAPDSGGRALQLPEHVQPAHIGAPETEPRVPGLCCCNHAGVGVDAHGVHAVPIGEEPRGSAGTAPQIADEAAESAHHALQVAQHVLQGAQRALVLALQGHQSILFG
mmetsp:Transcript_24086/g.72002  ORF Transcript_24086/g.72002 Transcript_24086/m.72002 type:complete len:254 (+) Transcript_24086:185-946(+)